MAVARLDEGQALDEGAGRPGWPDDDLHQIVVDAPELDEQGEGPPPIGLHRPEDRFPEEVDRGNTANGRHQHRQRGPGGHRVVVVHNDVSDAGERRSFGACEGEVGLVEDEGLPACLQQPDRESRECSCAEHEVRVARELLTQLGEQVHRG